MKWVEDLLVLLLRVDQHCSPGKSSVSTGTRDDRDRRTSVRWVDLDPLDRRLGNGHLHAGSKWIDKTISDMLLGIKTIETEEGVV